MQGLSPFLHCVIYIYIETVLYEGWVYIHQRLNMYMCASDRLPLIGRQPVPLSIIDSKAIFDALVKNCYGNTSIKRIPGVDPKPRVKY